MAKFKAQRLGALPSAKVNAALGLELDDADVWASKAAHKHVAMDHPEDYPLIWPVVDQVIEAPAFIGQKPTQPNNFYLVRRFPGEVGPVLVAIGIERNEHGTYNLRSAYRITEDDLEAYKRSGHLMIVK